MTPYINYIVVCYGKPSLFNRKCTYKSWMFLSHPIQVVMLWTPLLSQVILMSAEEKKNPLREVSHGNVRYPPQSYPPQEIAGLIKGLLTIGFP